MPRATPLVSGRGENGPRAPANRARGWWDAAWRLGDGLQGILSSTGQVQCGQVHCRLPYTAPPVHLKADMDGPLSNRGEKVNGARLGGVGQTPPPRRDRVSGRLLVTEQAPSARHTQAPLSPTTQSLDLVPLCQCVRPAPWWLSTTAGLVFSRFMDLVISLKRWAYITHHPASHHRFLLLLPPLCSYLLRVNILSWWGPGTAGQPVALGQLVRPPLWNPISGCLKQ